MPAESSKKRVGARSHLRPCICDIHVLTRRCIKAHAVPISDRYSPTKVHNINVLGTRTGQFESGKNDWGGKKSPLKIENFSRA